VAKPIIPKNAFGKKPFVCSEQSHCQNQEVAANLAIGCGLMQFGGRCNEAETRGCCPRAERFLPPLVDYLPTFEWTKTYNSDQFNGDVIT